MRTHWSALVVVDEDNGVVYDDAARRLLLDELKTKGQMKGAYLTRVWLRHEDPSDRQTWGPTRREIDWEGFSPTPPQEG
jgi:hypothetical protein